MPTQRRPVELPRLRAKPAGPALHDNRTNVPADDLAPLAGSLRSTRISAPALLFDKIHDPLVGALRIDRRAAGMAPPGEGHGLDDLNETRSRSHAQDQIVIFGINV